MTASAAPSTGRKREQTESRRISLCDCLLFWQRNFYNFVLKDLKWRVTVWVKGLLMWRAKTWLRAASVLMHSTMASANRFRFPVYTRFAPTAWRYFNNCNRLISFLSTCMGSLSLESLTFFSSHNQQGMVPKRKNNVTCPNCKRVFQLPGEGAVTDLPTNNFALCILQLLKDRRSWLMFIHTIFILASSISNNLNMIS